jgi:hypothetical protein
MRPALVANVPSFDNSVKVLTQAYLNNQIVNDNCSACAVGNLIAYALHISYVRFLNDDLPIRALCWLGSSPRWGFVLRGTLKESDNEQPGYSAQEQIAATGYTLAQLTLLEDAFEWPLGLNRNTCTNAERTYQGLLAVVVELAKIHGVDLFTSERAAAGFTQEYDRLIQLAALAKTS